MRKTVAYYSTAFNGQSYTVQKLTPELEPAGKPYHVSFTEQGTPICSCIARKTDCRHVQMIRKFREANTIGRHPPYDFDNDRFYEAPSYLTEM